MMSMLLVGFDESRSALEFPWFFEVQQSMMVVVEEVEILCHYPLQKKAAKRLDYNSLVVAC